MIQLKQGQTWRHKKRGTNYEILSVTATLQVQNSILDMSSVVIYVSRPEGQIWVRPIAEFLDGRFEHVPTGGARG